MGAPRIGSNDPRFAYYFGETEDLLRRVNVTIRNPAAIRTRAPTTMAAICAPVEARGPAAAGAAVSAAGAGTVTSVLAWQVPPPAFAPVATKVLTTP